MFWFAAKTIWYVGRFILTPKTSKIIFTKCFPSSGKPTIPPIPIRTNYVENALNLARRYNIPSAMSAVRTGLATFGYFVYSILWAGIIFALDLVYLYGKVILDQTVSLLLSFYKTGFDYISTYVGQVTDGFLLIYTGIFGLLFLYIAYRIFRYVYAVAENIYAILRLGRKSVDDFTNELELREEQNRTYFADNFNHHLDKLPIAGRVVTETTREGWVLIKPLFDNHGNMINLHSDSAVTNKNTKKR